MLNVLDDSEPTPLTGTERAWSEYLAWTRGAHPSQYEQTERLAWKRLQSALIDASRLETPKDVVEAERKAREQEETVQPPPSLNWYGG